ncbi:MAG: hypothetical protein QME94_10100 [Anaerolineae bacterium]|nr:hypothetical protein [Anaerolineae bacterium]
MRSTACHSDRPRRVLAWRIVLVWLLLSTLLLSCDLGTEAYRLRALLRQQGERAGRQIQRLGQPMVEELRRLGQEIGGLFSGFGR